MQIFYKAGFLMALATALLAANFYGHILSTLPVDRFLNNEFPSERFVMTRIVLGRDHGLSFGGGFMHTVPAVEELFMATDMEPYRDFTQRAAAEAQADQAQLYPSHVGLQDDLLFPVWRGLYALRDAVLERAREGSRWQQRMLHFDAYYVIKGTQLAVAVMNALVLALILLWVMREFSALVAYMTLGFMLIALPDLTFFGRSMWWMMFTWFLPFLVLAAAYRQQGGRPLRWFVLLPVSALAGGCLALKAAMGYEFTSTIMVSSLIPATFYALSRPWRGQDWLVQCLVIGLFQLAGIAAALYWHYGALEGIGRDPLTLFTQRFQMRAYGGETAVNLPDILKHSVHIPLIEVYGRHLFWHQYMGRPEILVTIPGLLWLWQRRQRWRDGFTADRVDRALLACIALGGLGAASMFTILKGHAYIHNFDVVAFSVPMNLLIGVFYARRIEKRLGL